LLPVLNRIITQMDGDIELISEEARSACLAARQWRSDYLVRFQRADDDGMMEGSRRLSKGILCQDWTSFEIWSKQLDNARVWRSIEGDLVNLMPSLKDTADVWHRTATRNARAGTWMLFYGSALVGPRIWSLNTVTLLYGHYRRSEEVSQLEVYGKSLQWSRAWEWQKIRLVAMGRNEAFVSDGVRAVRVPQDDMKLGAEELADWSKRALDRAREKPVEPGCEVFYDQMTQDWLEWRRNVEWLPAEAEYKTSSEVDNNIGYSLDALANEYTKHLWDCIEQRRKIVYLRNYLRDGTLHGSVIRKLSE
jgi:hypothetical protein